MKLIWINVILALWKGMAVSASLIILNNLKYNISNNSNNRIKSNERYDRTLFLLFAFINTGGSWWASLISISIKISGLKKQKYKSEWYFLLSLIIKSEERKTRLPCIQGFVPDFQLNTCGDYKQQVIRQSGTTDRQYSVCLPIIQAAQVFLPFKGPN